MIGTQPRRTPASSGFSLVEPLIVSIIVVLAVAASATSILIANRRFNATQQRIEMNREIDNNLSQIKDLARTYTCCAWPCTTALPTRTESNAPSATAWSCSTADWRSRNYYYPARDDTSTPTTGQFLADTTTPPTPSEVIAVDEICQTANNTRFMTPFQTAVNNTPQGTGWTRATTIQTEKNLRITYTDTANNVVVRTAYIRPIMASYCSASE